MIKRVGQVFGWGLLACALGCVGQFTYTRPVTSEAPLRSMTVPRSAQELWQALPAALNGGPYVVQRLDPNAGVAVLNYRGDPAPYVDCGHITSYVKNLRGERVYRFSGAQASVEYELMTGKEILLIDREMSLEGNLTLTLATAGPGSTLVSANARYVLTRTLEVRDVFGRSQTLSHLVEFGSNGEGTFPGPLTCRATGAWEYEVFSRLPK